MDKVIEIIYIVTGDYIKYSEGFMASLKYFVPGVKKKVIVLSNKDADFSNYVGGDIISINVTHIFDLIYPCINLHKSYFIEQLPDVGANYIFYFDADTVFKEVPNYDWNSLFADLDDDKVLISKHPMYAAKNTFKLMGITKKDWIDNFFTANMTEKNPSKCGYIDADVYTYVISSFFAANAKIMHVLNNRIILMTRKDLSRFPDGYHIPRFMDENYFNALAYDYSKGISNDNLKFSVKQYSELWNGDNNAIDTVFLYQKNMPNFKTNRR